MGMSSSERRNSVQKWEYCRLNGFGKYSVTVMTTLLGTKNIEVKRDKSKGDQTDEDAYCRVIAELGSQGWEAIGYLGQTGTILFKRPLA